MKLTPLILEKMYLALVVCRPINKWDMPPVELIQFKATNDPEALGTYEYDDSLDKPHIITISKLRNAWYQTAQRTMLHEMVHCSLWKSSWTSHGKIFRSRTYEISKELGLDHLEL